MRTYKVEFDFDGYDVMARGKVMNAGNVLNLVVQYRDCPEEEYPDENTKASIVETALELLVEKAFCPEVE
jgi:hypothetical protein